MFRSIRKYTPLLRRLSVFFLAFLLFFSCFLRPIKVNAYVAWDPASAAVWAFLQASGFFSDSAEAGATVLAEIIDTISDEAAKGVPAFIALLTVINNVSGNARIRLTDQDRAALAFAIFNNPLVRNLLKHNSVDLTDDELTQQQIPIISAGVEMYVPTEAAMQDIMSITQMQVLYEGFIDEQVEISKETNSILNKIRVFLGTIDLNMKAEIARSTATIQRFLNIMNNNLMNYINNVVQEVYNLRQSLSGRLDNLNNTLSAKLDSVDTKLHAINQNFLSKIADISQKITNLSDSLIYRVNNIMTYIDTLPQDIASQLRGEFTALKQSLDQFMEKIPSLQQSLDEILEKIPVYDENIEIIQKPQIEVQVGQQQILVSDYASMEQAFSAKMAWVPQIFDFLAELRSQLESGKPPKVTLSLNTEGGSIDWYDDVVVLDMSWYEPYKPLFDVVISGCLWLCFGWAIYKRIPDILSGVGLTVENATEPRGHVWSDRAERSESLKYRSDRREDYYRRRGG